MEEMEEKARPKIPSDGSDEKESDSEVTGEKYCLRGSVNVKGNNGERLVWTYPATVSPAMVTVSE